MAYTDRNFRTKKELRQAIALWETGNGKPVTYYQAGPYGLSLPKDGVVYLEGPHYPEPHRWYAQATAVDGVIVKAK